MNVNVFDVLDEIEVTQREVANDEGALSTWIVFKLAQARDINAPAGEVVLYLQDNHASWLHVAEQFATAAGRLRRMVDGVHDDEAAPF